MEVLLFLSFLSVLASDALNECVTLSCVKVGIQEQMIVLPSVNLSCCSAMIRIVITDVNTCLGHLCFINKADILRPCKFLSPVFLFFSSSHFCVSSAKTKP